MGKRQFEKRGEFESEFRFSDSSREMGCWFGRSSILWRFQFREKHPSKIWDSKHTVKRSKNVKYKKIATNTK